MLTCPFLSYLSPVQLTKLLTKWANANYPYLNPIWLNNNGQNVVGFLPKKAFYLQIPTTKDDCHEKNDDWMHLQLMTVTRNQELDLSDFFDKKYSTNNAKDIKIQLSNNQNIESFVDALIEYSQSFHTSNINNQDDKNDHNQSYNNGYIGYVGYDVSASELANSSSLTTSSIAKAKHKQTLNSLQVSSTNVTDNTSDINEVSITLDTLDGNDQHNRRFFQTQQPTAYFGHYPIYLSCRLVKGIYQWQLHANDSYHSTQLDNISKWLAAVVKSSRPIVTNTLTMNMRMQWSYEKYAEAFAHTQDYLHAGDCYQINLTQAWQGSLPNKHDLVDYLPKLHAHTNTPFAGYLSTQGFELLSCSPELFLTFKTSKQKQQIIETKPIKGTMPRGATATEDDKLKAKLANSKKDLAENVMIVDLLRNDLGKYAQTGTVNVPKCFAIESFNNVHHMVSTITATLKEDIHPLKMLFDSLPAGSITGTPKKRSVEIINELEQQPRGAYCGTMGYMNFDNDGNCSGQWNVLIRTLQAKNRQVSLWAGGGITVSSNVDDEYQECWDKVSNIIEVLAGR